MTCIVSSGALNSTHSPSISIEKPFSMHFAHISLFSIALSFSYWNITGYQLLCKFKKYIWINTHLNTCKNEIKAVTFWTHGQKHIQTDNVCCYFSTVFIAASDFVCQDWMMMERRTRETGTDRTRRATTWSAVVGLFSKTSSPLKLRTWKTWSKNLDRLVIIWYWENLSVYHVIIMACPPWSFLGDTLWIGHDACHLSVRGCHLS